MSHWRSVSTSEAVRHRLYGMYETLGVFRAGLLLEPLVLIPLSLAVVFELSGAGLYLLAGEVALGLTGWGCAWLLGRMRPEFVRAYELRAVVVGVWSVVVWAAVVAPGPGLFASGVDAVVLYAFFGFIRFVMTSLYAAYTFVSPRLNVTVLHRVSK